MVVMMVLKLVLWIRKWKYYVMVVKIVLMVRVE